HSQTSGPYDDQPWNPAEGQTAWINFVDPDDSEGEKECYGNNSLFPHTPGKGGTWMYFNPAGGPPLFVSGASQIGYLPNNTLASVMHYTAGDTAYVGEPTINATEPNHTYCMRGYKRW